MRASLTLGAVGVVAGTLLVAHVSCKSYGSGGGDGGMNPGGPPILIGASIGQTGGLAGQDHAMQGGLTTAQLQINALGGVLDRQIQFTIENDSSQPGPAITALKSLLSASSVAIIGPGASSQVQADYPFIKAAALVDISSTATSILLTEGYSAKQGWFFRTVPDDTSQGKAVAQFAWRGPNGMDASTGGCARMAIVYNDDAYGAPMDKIIEPTFTTLGGTIAPPSISVPANAAGSYLTQATTIVSALPDCMTMVVFAPVGDQLLHDLGTAIVADIASHPAHAKHWNNSFFVIGTDGCYDPSFITNGRVSPSDTMSMSFVQTSPLLPIAGVYGTTADSNPPNRPQYNDFKTLYEAEVGLAPGSTDPDPYTSNEYDAAILLALAIQAAGSTDGAAVRSAMFDVSRGKHSGATAYGPLQVADAINALKHGQDINYNGAAGDEDFDDYGNVIGDFIIWQVQGTQFMTHDHIAASQL